MIRTDGYPQKANFALGDIIEAQGMRGREGEAWHDVSPEGRLGRPQTEYTARDRQGEGSGGINGMNGTISLYPYLKCEQACNEPEKNVMRTYKHR
jgi:hypothetical protein